MQYINTQLRYHLGFTTKELKEMDDAEWAEQFAILQHIREQESKQKPFG